MKAWAFLHLEVRGIVCAPTRDEARVRVHTAAQEGNFEGSKIQHVLLRRQRRWDSWARTQPRPICMSPEVLIGHTGEDLPPILVDDVLGPEPVRIHPPRDSA